MGVHLCTRYVREQVMETMSTSRKGWIWEMVWLDQVGNLCYLENMLIGSGEVYSISTSVAIFECIEHEESLESSWGS